MHTVTYYLIFIFFLEKVSLSIFDSRYILKEKFENTKGIIRSRKSKKDRQYNGKRNRTKGQTQDKSLKIPKG